MVNTVGSSVNNLSPYLTAEFIEEFSGGREALRKAMLAIVDDNLKPIDEQSLDLGDLGGNYATLGAAISVETNHIYGLQNGDVEIARLQLIEAIDFLLKN